jgi:hypothetical protein
MTQPADDETTFRRYVAYHEAGHALFAMLYADVLRVRRATCVPKPGLYEGGCLLAHPTGDPRKWTRRQLIGFVRSLLAGCQAAWVESGVTRQAPEDLERAYQIAIRVHDDEDAAVLWLENERKAVEATFRQPEVWRVLEAIAEALLREGMLGGRKLRRIAEGSFESTRTGHNHGQTKSLASRTPR